MADISKMNVNGTEYNIKDAAARREISSINDEVGTLGSVAYTAQSEARAANDTAMNGIASVNDTFNKFCYEVERNVSTDGNPCCILERVFENYTMSDAITYGISEMILSGYIKWTENGTEQVGRFSMDITRAVQGVSGSATTYLAGTTVAHGSFIPKMFTLKVTIQKPWTPTDGTDASYYPKYNAIGEHGLAFHQAKVSDGSTSQDATVSSLRVRTILFRILEQK